MAKEAGLAWTVCSIDDAAGDAQAIINDFTTLDFATPRGVQDVTGLDSDAMERLLLLADFTITLGGVFNDTADKSHDVFKTVPSTSVTRTVTLTVSGKTLPNETLFTDYAISRAADGSMTFSAPGVLNSTTVPTWA